MDILVFLGHFVAWGIIVCFGVGLVMLFSSIFECSPAINSEEKERLRLELQAHALARQRYEDSMDENTKALKDLLVFVKQGTVPTPLFDAAITELQARNMCQVVQEE